MILLGHNGMLPHYDAAGEETKISPRRKGVKQGALLILIGAVLVPPTIVPPTSTVASPSST